MSEGQAFPQNPPHTPSNWPTYAELRDQLALAKETIAQLQTLIAENYPDSVRYRWIRNAIRYEHWHEKEQVFTLRLTTYTDNLDNLIDSLSAEQIE